MICRFTCLSLSLFQNIATSLKMTKEIIDESKMTPMSVIELALISLSKRTREAQLSMAQLKVRHQKSSDDWQLVVELIMEARKELDELKAQQEFFSLECQKKSDRGALELLNF